MKCEEIGNGGGSGGNGGGSGGVRKGGNQTSSFSNFGQHLKTGARRHTSPPENSELIGPPSSSVILSEEAIAKLNLTSSSSHVGNRLSEINVYVTEIRKEVDAARLSSHLSQFGAVQHVQMGVHPHRGTQFAFVCFPDKQCATNALQGASKSKLEGKTPVMELALGRKLLRMAELTKLKAADLAQNKLKTQKLTQTYNNLPS